MVSQPLEAQKNILGYTLKERIGSGGFGEVWSAIAPGGLLKALKIVYGFHDENRAQTEMKALDRVKGLRHPFLLSLERIEIYEGQLIVVTELADNSLADVFNLYAAKGEPGIPREELVKYIRCAADALDYLSDEQNLQHLDIKPENLLMVSGHVKVADFGLIKDLQNASQSLMSGMTPAYAAPELFDGRPGKKSDQYSLAIVYQEMLTGVRPFPGTTPAQLAAQHMHGKPNLRPLPKGDQSVVAKALSKDPNVRFNNCRDMAEELANQKRTIKKAIRRTHLESRERADTESKTVNFGLNSNVRDVTAVISDGALPFQAAELVPLDPPTCNGETATVRPTLIVGVGHTANRIIQKIKGQLVGRHGATANIPSIRLVCIDTDRQALGELRMSTGPGALDNHEFIETPLRKPEAYRDRRSTHLNWLSRRWIYNVPRSLQTEGLRPLGRLGFADHFEAICDNLQDALKSISKEENLAKTADTLDLDPGTLAPRVVILTSISGGVGSGMTLDLAYTIKVLMQECGLAHDSVTGVLMHSTYQRTRDPGLSAANAFAFLTEMRHYVENGFPGDESVGLPEFDDEPPFDFTYFNDLGHNLRQSEFEEKLEKVAEYVYLSTASPCSEFFDACHSFESELEHFALRTFGLSVSGPGKVNMSINASNEVARGLIRRWLNGDSAVEFDPIAEVALEFAKLKLDQETVIQRVSQHAHQILDGTYAAVTAGAREIALGESPNRISNLAAYLDGAIGCPFSRRESGQQDPEICVELEEQVGNDAVAVGDQLSTSLMALMGGSEMNLHNTQLTVNGCVEKLELLRQQLDRATAQSDAGINQQLAMLASFSLDKTRVRAEELKKFDAVLDEYCLQRFQEFVMRQTRVFYRVIAQSLDALKTMVRRFQTQVEAIAGEFEATDDEVATEDAKFNMDLLLNDCVVQQIQQLISRTELQVFESMVKEQGGYLQLLNDPTTCKHQLPSEIRTASQRILTDAYKKISLANVVAQNNVKPDQLVKWLNEKMREARPQVDNCGGATRMLVGLPALTNETIFPELLEKHFSVKGCTIKGTQGNFVLCFEGEDVSLANVAYRLLEARPDAIELVKRIQTRNDVQWTTLDDLL